MAFFDLLKSMLGGAAQQELDGEGFQLQPDSHGVNFFTDTDSLHGIKTGQGDSLLKMQHVALKMLEEQSQATPIANGFHVPSESVAGMEEDVAAWLGLPKRYEGAFSCKISGHTKSSSFKVNVFAQIDREQVPYKRKGALLYLTSTEVFRLRPEELMALEAIDRHLALDPDDRGEAENLKLLARLQVAERSGMNVDLSHFERLDVVVPEDIGVTATRQPDGSLFLCPSLGEGSTEEELGSRWGQLELDKEGSGVMRINNRIVLLEPEKLEGIKEVLGNRKIPADRVSEFIESPSAFLDAALVNLDLGFSVRVEGVGKLRHMDFGEDAAKKQDWFALDEFLEPPEAIPGAIQSHEELEQFKESREQARGQGAEAMGFGGRNFDISNDEAVSKQLEGVQKRLDESAPSEEGESEEDPLPPKQSGVTVVLKDAEGVHLELLSEAERTVESQPIEWSAYARKPFPHQMEGVEWLLNLVEKARHGEQESLYRLQGAILADDMGLGKTYVCLSGIREYFERQKLEKRKEKPALVVAPLSLLENWEDEVDLVFNASPFRDIVVLQGDRDLKRFRVQGAKRETVQMADLENDDDLLDTSSIRYALHVGPDASTKRLDQERRLVLATYQTLRDYQLSLCQIDWGVVVFDEAQNIKNPNTLQTRAAKGLKADFKLLATGTPVENSLGDFWCLMDTAQPGLLGSWQEFRDAWIKPVNQAEEQEKDELRTQLGQDLRASVGPFMLRRVKEDQLSGLPQKTIYCGVPQSDHDNVVYDEKLTSTMPKPQIEAYDQILSDYRASTAQGDGRGKALAALQKLRIISLHPGLDQSDRLMTGSAKEAKDVMRQSGKLDVLLERLEAIRSCGEKVILFMVTKKLQMLVKAWLDEIYGLDIGIINGDTQAVPKKSDTLSRKQMISRFEQEDGFNIMIMSPVAAGVGLTIVGANHAIHLERHWNPAKEAQATDRIYRIGQQKPVSIHLPATLHPTVDAFDVHLDRLLRSKLMLKDAVVTPEPVSESEVLRSMGL